MKPQLKFETTLGNLARFSSLKKYYVCGLVCALWGEVGVGLDRGKGAEDRGKVERIVTGKTQGWNARDGRQRV